MNESTTGRIILQVSTFLINQIRCFIWKTEYLSLRKGDCFEPGNILQKVTQLKIVEDSYGKIKMESNVYIQTQTHRFIFIKTFKQEATINK